MELRDVKYNIDINIRRLERHYDFCLKKYDDIALLDLSHALRNFVDFSKDIDRYFDSINLLKKYRGFIVSKKAGRMLKMYNYLIIGFPGSVETFANNDDLLFVPNEKSLPVHLNMKIKRNKDDSSSIGNYFLVRSNVEKSASRIIDNSIQVKLFNKFDYWLDSDALKINESEFQIKSLSRRNLITWVSNTLGGSHPANNRKRENENDPLINYLMNFTIGGVSLPYFILMGISKEILTVLNSIPTEDKGL
ncbi:MAG: hypothetical protein JXR60_11490 [Bacteroidales bacterium]|nr:hypothetical protein [Bacteroidales bacterium]